MSRLSRKMDCRTDVIKSYVSDTYKICNVDYVSCISPWGYKQFVRGTEIDQQSRLNESWNPASLDLGTARSSHFTSASVRPVRSTTGSVPPRIRFTICHSL